MTTLADQIIDGGPYEGRYCGGVLGLQFAEAGNRLRDELLELRQRRQADERRERFWVEPAVARTGRAHIRLACRRCPWEFWTDEAGTLPELLRRADQHREECR